MTRTRASAKKAGTEFETLIVRFLSVWLRDDRIERRARNGRNDRGDVAGVRTSRGARVVIEAKNVSTMSLKTWMNEAEIEAGNDDSLYPVVIHKAHGEGRPEKQWVTMRLETFARFLEGGPDDEGEF